LHFRSSSGAPQFGQVRTSTSGSLAGGGEARAWVACGREGFSLEPDELIEGQPNAPE
jgi:hypothetical protein